MNWKTHKKQLLSDPSFRQAFDDTEPEFQIARAVITARLKKGYSQQTLAEKLHTKQSVISRVENAKTMPSLAFLKKVATALDEPIHIQIRP